MSKSKLDEVMELVTELREKGVTVDAAIKETEERLSLLRAIRRATSEGDAEPKAKPRGKPKGSGKDTGKDGAA